MPVMNYLTTCIFDHGALSTLQNTLSGLGGSKPLVVTDQGIKAAGILERVLEALGHEPAAIFADTVPNPTEDQAIETAELYKSSGADSIIAVGGGSSMDLAKAAGLLGTHDGPLEKYAAMSGGSQHIKKLPPLIAIPTTAGTGSEVSVGFINTLNNGRKETFAAPALIPATAICDPDLTFGLPAHLTGRNRYGRCHSLHRGIPRAEREPASRRGRH